MPSRRVRQVIVAAKIFISDPLREVSADSPRAMRTTAARQPPALPSPLVPDGTSVRYAFAYRSHQWETQCREDLLAPLQSVIGVVECL